MTKQEGNSLIKPAILFLDVETAPMILTSHTLRPEYLPYDGILQDWYIICACWKWQGNKSVYSESVTPDDPTNDKEVVQSLAIAITQADIICGHNIKKFDIKKLNARLIFHGLQPIPAVPTVDTLLEVRKIAAFTSNRLDYLGKFLLGKGKIHTSQELWYASMRGEVPALNKMTKYCKQDVIVLEKIYDKLKPYMKNHPHVGVISGGQKVDCPKCGSIDVVKVKVRVTSGGAKTQQYQCKQCGSYHTTTYKETKQI